MTPFNIVAFTPFNIVAFTPFNIVAFTPFNIVTFTPFNIVTFTPFNIVAFTPFNIVAFTPFNIVTFTPFNQWRHQDLKSGGGGKKGATIDYGGGKHVRVAHIASAKREPIFFELLGSDFFWANMCAERT